MSLEDVLANDPCTLALAQTGARWDAAWSYADYGPTATDGGRWVGKWLLFPACATAPDDWAGIVAETAAGAFWSAKISLACDDTGEHVICVYTPDYRDLPAVQDVGRRLLGLGLARTRDALYYKPDRFTRAGVYRDAGPASIFVMWAHSRRPVLLRTRGFDRLDPATQVELAAAFAAMHTRTGG